MSINLPYNNNKLNFSKQTKKMSRSRVTAKENYIESQHFLYMTMCVKLLQLKITSLCITDKVPLNRE